ncbi:MAG TPA: hypothetical protein DIW77_07025 [Chromatiaceae bacterium]|nr:hypothetical protein [Chromatiaceae bacterium]
MSLFSPTPKTWTKSSCAGCRCGCWRISRRRANGCGRIRPTVLVRPAAERLGSVRRRAAESRATKAASRRACFQDSLCGCSHHTRARPGTGAVEDPSLEPVALSEWRLVGPGLASLIVALRLRFRMSYRRIGEFLHDWLGLSLSVGTLKSTLHEAAAAGAPLEQELIDAAVASDLLHADETPWPQGSELLWLWVFTSATVTLFVVVKRGRGILDRLLPDFAGWLMTLRVGWRNLRNSLPSGSTS